MARRPSGRRSNTGTKSTTARGLGHRHQQQRARLLKLHVDGTLCDWCGKPMFRSQELEADHSQARSQGGSIADRLLHALCNRQRGDGTRGDTQEERARLVAAETDQAQRAAWCVLKWT